MNTPSRTDWSGRYRALVIDDRDPLYKMRVKVRIPDLMIADKKHVGVWDTNGLWASPSNNYLGGRTIQDTKMRHKGPDAYYQGSCLIPPKGTHVWVWFEKDDVSHPFYDGAAEYGDVQALPENQLGSQYQKKWTLLKTCQGRCLVVSDDDDDARFEITGKKREIKDPPFGDIDSVYKIDDNQTVFLIDERPQHEKVLLKDYRGNFFKLIQDENGINDQFHARVQNDVHLEFQKDFYMTIFGNMHIKVLGDIYVTSLKDIFVNATLKLQETALSIDRFASTYDNRIANVINNISGTNINSTAVMKIFEQSLQNVRNSMVTSDVSMALTTIQAGAAIGITAAGAVSIYGGGGTAIQSTPVTNPLSGFAEYAEVAPEATESKPDPERYEKIILPPDAPILTTPTGKTCLTGDKVCHDPVPVSQCASSKVGAAGGNANSAAAAAASGCCGGGGNQSSSCGGGNKGTSSGSGSSQGESGLNSGGCSGGGCGGSPILDPNSDVPNYDITSGSNNGVVTTDSSDGGVVQTIFDCCGSAFNTAMDATRSVTSATSSLLGWLGNITSGITDDVYSVISGVGIDPASAIGSLVSPYTISPSFASEIWEHGSLLYTPYYSELMQNTANDLMFEIVHNIGVQVQDLTGLPVDVYRSVSGDWNFINHYYSDYADNLLMSSLYGIYDNILPEGDYYSTALLDSVLSTIQGNIGNEGADWNFRESLTSAFNSSIDMLVYDFTDGYMNTSCIPDLQKTYFNHIDSLSNFTLPMIAQFTEPSCTAICDSMCFNINQSSQMMIDNIANKVTIQPEATDTYLSEEQLTTNLQKVQLLVTDFQDTCNNPEEIEKFKEDPDRLETLKTDLIDNCKTAIAQNTLSSEDASTRFAIANDSIAKSVSKSLTPLTQDVDKQTVSKQLSNVNNIILSDLQKDSYSLTSDFTEFEETLKTTYSEKLSAKIKEDYKDRVKTIVDSVPVKETRDTQTIAKLKDDIKQLVSDINGTLGSKDIFASVITHDDITGIVSDLHENTMQHFPSEENNTAKQALEDFREQLESDLNVSRKETLGTIFDLNATVDNQFSKYTTETYTVPAQAGCGYTGSLFLKDKYRKTLPALTSHSGGTTFAFDIVMDVDKFDYTTKDVWSQEEEKFTQVREYHPFFDWEAIKSYQQIWKNLSEGKEIDTTGKWWRNLSEILTQCSIYDLLVVITIQDFADPNNPFIYGIDERKVFTDSMWRDEYEGKFLQTLYSFIKETRCKVIYNIGYGSFKNPYDLNCQKYKIYPNCGYLRRFIMWSVYKCGVTSNIMALTANEKDNLYYYNPYCEWKSFDDDQFHELEDSQILIRDCVDGMYNDGADIVTYEKGKINGGYSSCLINSSKYSIAVFAMNNLVGNIPVGADINDPNIMSSIFCRNSRTALRYFKGGNYFDFQELQFDENGEVI